MDGGKGEEGKGEMKVRGGILNKERGKKGEENGIKGMCRGRRRGESEQKVRGRNLNRGEKEKGKRREEEGIKGMCKGKEKREREQKVRGRSLDRGRGKREAEGRKGDKGDV